MINLINIDKISRNMTPVTTTEYNIGKSESFHPNGLFSELIFGAKDSTERRENYSYIDLHCKVLHPALIKPLERLNKKMVLAIFRENTYKFDKTENRLIEDKDGDINGITSIIKNFEKFLDRKETNKTRIDIRNMIYSYHKRNMAFIDKYLIIPAAYRDAVLDEIRGGYRINPINDYYVRIIRQGLQLESFSMKEGPLYDILTAKMQTLVYDLYNYLVEKISKKQGIIRQSLLGKRVDYSGRAVITGGSDQIKINEIGIPFRMLVNLFEPFILHDIYNTENIDKKLFSELIFQYNGSTFGIPGIRSIISGIQKGNTIPKQLEDIIKSSVNRAIKDKVVLAKRDPALHAESVQGFYPVMVDGDTIRLNPLKCSAYNADFDGDQMAVYVPLTKEAIEQVKEKMITSQSKDSMTSINEDFSKDIVIGLYCLTQNPKKSNNSPRVIKSDSELENLSVNEEIKYDGKVTTAGRIIFNKRLPAVKYWINEPLNKDLVKTLASKIYSDYYQKERQVYIDFCHTCVELGTKYYTLVAPSFGIDDLVDVPKSILALKDKFKNSKSVEEANNIQNEMDKQIKQYLESADSDIGLIGKAGGLKGGYNQVRQILISKGLIQSIDKEVRKLDSSYSDGFKSSEFFESGYGSRAGIVDRVINTSETGYLSRRLVYALQRVEANPNIKDCGTTRFFTLKATPDIAKRLTGRYILDKNKIVPFDKKIHTNKIIKLRSPLYCNTVQLCRKCYGDLIDRNDTQYVGVLAGEICGERLTQTIMRTFHVGGAVSIKSFDIISSLTKIMDDSEKKFFSTNFSQNANNLISKIDTKIVIDVGLYNKTQSSDIKINADSINMKYGYFNIKYLSFDLDATIDNNILIDLKDKKINRKDDIIEILCPAKSILFTCLPTEEKFSEKVKIIESLLSARAPWKNSDHFCLKIYDFYNELKTDADMVHFEVLASNLLRDSGNPSYPARLNSKNYKAILRALDDIPKLESWLQALAFQEPSEAITTGLLYGRPKSETIFEKIITGNFD